MSLKKLKKEYRESTPGEIRQAVLENAVYGFLGSILVVFIAQRMDIAVLIGYMTYYFFVGRVINRPKYVTSLGKFIVFPTSAALGAFVGYKLAYLLSTYLS
tara:strand:+ start:335 stop:637 length:303 start_codon:yes stop_codon:yes gene_type:complete